ncbi:MAG: glycosyltransferase, partial [Eggerthellaceae bacterium]|nr:glycosyltransferase [Eggerthellaceae bacterium]
KVKGWKEPAVPTSVPTPSPQVVNLAEPVNSTNPSKPVVSVIIPVYNVEAYIRESIESLQMQTLTDFEAICVSDGSTDASMAIARLIVADDPRFRFFEKENGGQGSARNYGIELARGEYITFLDPDDYYLPETLNELVTYAQANNLDYLDFTAHSFYETARARQARNESYYENRPHIEGIMSGRELFVAYQQAVEYHCSVCLHFFKRSLLDAQNDQPALRFDESLPVHEDELFSPLLIVRAERAAYLPKACYQRRVRDESSMTSGRGLRNVACMYEVQKQLRAFAEQEMNAGKSDAVQRECISAFLQRVAELRNIMAEDALRVSSAELIEYAGKLPKSERIEFELLSIQAARQLEQAHRAPEQRIGSAIMAAPRWIKRRF